MQVPCIKGPKTYITFRGALKIHLDKNNLYHKTNKLFREAVKRHLDNRNENSLYKYY